MQYVILLLESFKIVLEIVDLSSEIIHRNIICCYLHVYTPKEWSSSKNLRF